MQTVQCPDRFYLDMETFEGIKQNELNYFDDVNNFTMVFPNVFQSYSNARMNFTGYINIQNKGTVTFYSRTNYMSTVAIDDKYVIYNFIDEKGNTSDCKDYSVLHQGPVNLEAGYHKYELYVLSSSDEEKFPFEFSYSDSSSADHQLIDSYYSIYIYYIIIIYQNRRENGDS